MIKEKKYILIKTYPGSPKLGTIKSSNSFGVIDDNVTDYNVAEYSKFWEEVGEKVEEKDYEILSLKSKASEIIKDPRTLWDKKMYGSYDFFIQCFTNSFWKIYSVKRLSDGVVFTIGDEIEYKNKKDKIIKDKILKFEVFNKKLLVGIDSYLVGINLIEISKKVLFTTEDGVDIFKGDSYCYTTPKGAIECTKTAHDRSGSLQNVTGYIYFSTKEKAEEYLLMETPCLSIKDIRNILTVVEIPPVLMPKFIELAKKKLNEE